VTPLGPGGERSLRQIAWSDRVRGGSILVVPGSWWRLKDVAGRARPFRLIHETPHADCCSSGRASVGLAAARTAPHRRGCW
jgi:hypothetical protein